MPNIFEEISIKRLWSIIGGSSNVNIEWLKEQLVVDLDQGKPYLHVHKDGFYMVTVEEMKEFFKTHSRPAQRVSVVEENEILKKKLAALEKELEASKGSKPLPPADDDLSFDGEDVVKARATELDKEKAEDPNLDLADTVTPLQSPKETPDTL